MKKEDITYQDKIDELILDISHPNSKGLVFIFVEGESDIKLFRKLFDIGHCKVESIPGGNPKVEECVKFLIERYPLIFGIRDSDFIQLNDKLYCEPNIFLTDFHDIEMTMVAQDDVFSAIVYEFTDIQMDGHNNLRSGLLNILEEISLLKWLNELESLNLTFKGVGFADLISFEKQSVDFNQYFSRVLSKSVEPLISQSDVLLNKIHDLKRRSPDPFHLCNGHDFLKAFAAYIMKINFSNMSDNQLSSLFRVKYSRPHFMNTTLYKNTSQWAESNHCSIYENN
ncbi:MAG: DUF4435 domain-containing protein [Bacteroidota bacterium]|nr:DUF4435 domain-containing protein [Bacteroidota bacterium]